MIVRILLVIAFLAAVYYFGTADKVKSLIKSQDTSISQNLSETKVTVEIITDTNAVKTYPEIVISGDVSVLDVTRTVTSVETRGEGENTIISALNGRIVNSAKKEYWTYLVNGNPLEISPESYKLKNGDVVTWKVATR